MKLKSILFVSSLCTLAIFASSCNKDDIDVESGITAQEAENTPCTHSLIHVNAQAPTGEENGCIEHYQCEHCGATFSDAAGQNAIDNIIIWATNYGNPDPDENPVLDNAGIYDDNGKFAKFADGEFMTNNLVTTGAELIAKLGNMNELQEFANDGSNYRWQILWEAGRIPDQQYKGEIQQIRNMQSAFADATDGAFVKLMQYAQCIISGQVATELDSISAIYAEWRRQTSSKEEKRVNDVFNQYTTFQGYGSLNSYPAYYDYAAMHSPDVLWESQSYQLRENARAADAILMCEYYTLIAVEKHLFQSGVSAANMSDLNNKMSRFAKVLKDNPVTYHRDVMISNIPGLNMTFKKTLNTLNAWDAINNNRDKFCWRKRGHYTSANDVRTEMNNNEDYIEQSVYKTIYSYYNQRYGSTNIYDIMREAGFTNVKDRLVANCEYNPYEDVRSEGNFIMRYNWNMFRYQIGDYKNEDWLGIRTCLTNNCDLCYTNVIVDANIEGNFGKITNMGKRCDVTFCSLIEVK